LKYEDTKILYSGSRTFDGGIHVSVTYPEQTGILWLHSLQALQKYFGRN